MENEKKHIIIIGGGFGGLYAAKKLANKNVSVTLIDKRNFHLFQPLLYQVATGGLSPGDISSPLRAVLQDAKNIAVLCAELDSINTNNKTISIGIREIKYDYLIIATGVSHHYFGNDQWSKNAPGLKTVEDALEIRQRVMRAFEEAELEKDPNQVKEWLRFVIVGGGPTGVELAGALGELAYQTLRKDFRNIDPTKTEIYLVEALDRILTSFPESLSKKAESSLKKLCVRIKTNSMVTDVKENQITLKTENGEETIRAKTVLWAAGVKASSVSDMIIKSTAAESDKAGRIIVDQYCRIPGNQNIFVIGDLAYFKSEDGNSLPGVAPVAMQQGDYVATFILKNLQDKEVKPFTYINKGNLAVIGRKAAVADVFSLKFSGWPAWLIWIFVHIAYLIEFDNKIMVLFQWAWNFFTRKRGARLITQVE